MDCDGEIEGLYRRRNAALKRSVARRIAQSEDAADVVQSAFAKLIVRLRVGALSDSAPYLAKLAANEATSLARSRQREIVARDRLAETSHSSLDPFPQLESRDLLNRIDDAVARLKPKTRLIFLAHRLDGLSYQQIADQNGMSVKGVEKHMSKAIAHLDRLLDRS